MSPSEYASKAEILRQGERLARANRGLLSVIQHLMSELGVEQVIVPFGELTTPNRIDIAADNEQLTVVLKPTAVPNH